MCVYVCLYKIAVIIYVMPMNGQSSETVWQPLLSITVKGYWKGKVILFTEKDWRVCRHAIGSISPVSLTQRYKVKIYDGEFCRKNGDYYVVRKGTFFVIDPHTFRKELREEKRLQSERYRFHSLERLQL